MYDETAVIYADILFLINFSIDFLCLFITSRVLNCGGKTYRLLLGGVIGGIYSFFPYIFSMQGFFSFVMSIVAAILITLTAFGIKTQKSPFLICGTFIISSALLGGLVTAVYNSFGVYSNGTYIEIDAISFCIICLLSAAATFSYGFICRKKIHIRSADIRIFINDKKIACRLLCDSGNLVTEPFSALPVIIVSSKSFPHPYNNPENKDFPLNIRAIPFVTSSGKGCFFGFRPDKIELVSLGKRSKIIDAYIGIDQENRNYSGYDGLMPTSLL